MSRLLVVLLVAFGSLSCGRASVPPAARVPSPRLDVVLVTVDTLRADATGFSGNGNVKTPAMDRLAAAGRVFTNAHAHNVVTLPSHTNILTGQLPFVHGVRDNAGARLAEDFPTIATRLKARGYATGAFVAAFPLDRRFGLGHGFDVYDDAYGKDSGSMSFRLAERPGAAVVASALAWWNAQAPGRRFLWVHLFEPHAPYAPPPPFDREYAKNPYLGEVAAADAALAPLLDPLLAPGAPPALVVLTGDHGESLGEHGEATHGLFCYEATLHVPLVLEGPRVETGRDSRGARHVDVLPTILDAIGAPAEPTLPGRSLLAAPEPSALSYFEALSAQLNRGWAPLHGVMRGETKYVDLPIRELYDLSADPKETSNLATTKDDVVRDLARLVPADASRPAKRAEPTAEEAARLRSLGYSVGTSAPRASYGPDDDPKRLVSLDRSIHEIVDLYQRGRLEPAISKARDLVRKRPTMALGLEHLAFLLDAADRPEEAVPLLERALAASGSEEIRVRLGLALSETGHAKEAVEALAPLASSKDPDALNALGTALADADRLADARKVFESAVALDPQAAQTLSNLGVVALRERKADEARARFEAAVNLNPKYARAWNGLGAAEAALGHTDPAMTAWAKAATLDPRDADSFLNLGLLAARVGNRQVAGAALRRFLDVAPPRYGKEKAEARAILRQVGAAALARKGR